jgi:thiamine-phosphate diphosphorylase
VTRWLQHRPVLYCITDRKRLSDPSVSGLLDHIRSVLMAGVHAVQIREPDLTDRELVDLVGASVRMAGAHGVPVLVNDRVDVALAAGAGGVHLKERSVRPDGVRKFVPPDFVIGCSVHSAEGAAALSEVGACDYLIFGTVYPSASKPDQVAVGKAALADVCQRVALPVLAVGGVDRSNAAAVATAGAAGIAAIGAFIEPDQMLLEAHTRAMIQEFHHGTRSQVSAD